MSFSKLIGGGNRDSGGISRRAGLAQSKADANPGRREIAKSMDDKLAEYQKLSRQIKALKESLDILNVEILKALAATNSKRLSTSYGLFTVREYRIWEYSDKITALEKSLKEEKSKEQEGGGATCQIKPSLMFRDIDE